ncbi:MAG: aldo/keto reductase [Bryobacterales bacterium]|nr:aldo/keto reductase [Bryobacterales bacterium]
MERRTLGTAGLSVSAMGLGCMGMSDFYGPLDDTESLHTLERALDLGIDFYDTADMYGVGKNEELLAKFLKGRRDLVVLATKFGFVRKPDGTFVGVNGKPEYVREACEASLRRLETDVIDLYYLHRMDPEVPIEDTVGAMARLVEEGKVRHLGLSEVGPVNLRKAASASTITALQTEYSLFSRDAEGPILDTCRELGIGFVAYSPLGRGLLTGRFRNPEDFSEGDWRRALGPRFSDENLAHNVRLVEAIETMAQEKRCTTAQLAIAWVMAQGEDIVPIPGTKRVQYLEVNAGAADIVLTEAELQHLATVVPIEAVAGGRYTPDRLKALAD